MHFPLLVHHVTFVLASPPLLELSVCVCIYIYILHDFGLNFSFLIVPL